MNKYKISINEEDEVLFKSLAKRLRWKTERLSPAQDKKILDQLRQHKTLLTDVSNDDYKCATFKLKVSTEVNVALLKNNNLLDSLSRYPLSSSPYHLAVRVIENDTTRMYFEVDERLKIVSILLIISLL